MRTRVALGAAGGLLMAFGAFRLLTEVALADLFVLAVWLAVAILLHDFVLSPFVVGAGWVLGRTAPPRIRRYLQAFLIVAGLITVIAIPLILREGTQPEQTTLLVQDYSTNLAFLLGLLAAATAVMFAVRTVLQRNHERT